MNNNFEDFYNSINKLELREIWENAKKKKNKKRYFVLIIIIIINLIVFFSQKELYSDDILTYNHSFFRTETIFLMFILDTAAVLLNEIIPTKEEKKYNQIYKEKIIFQLVNSFFSNVDYNGKIGLPKYIYNEGKYTEYYNEYSSDDYLKAKIDNKFGIEMAEVHTKKIETIKNKDGSTSTETKTIFWGLFTKIDIGKTINSEMRIKEGEVISLQKNRLKMDSEEFEKKFDVITNNKIVGMQILTHDVMELLIKFRENFKKQFDIFIEGNIMYIRFHVGRMFESKFSQKSVIDKEVLEKYYSIIEFVDKLSKEMIKIVQELPI